MAAAISCMRALPASVASTCRPAMRPYSRAIAPQTMMIQFVMTMPRSLLFVVLEGTGRQNEAAVVHTGEQTEQSCIPDCQRRHNDRADSVSVLLPSPNNRSVNRLGIFRRRTRRQKRSQRGAAIRLAAPHEVWHSRVTITRARYAPG